MYQFARNTLLITAAALGTVEYAANVNRGESFESDVLQILRNGELNPDSATTLMDAIARDPYELSELSRYMQPEENLMISRLAIPYNDQQWMIGLMGDSVVINSDGISRMAQGKLVEMDQAVVQNLADADLFLISHSIVEETQFDHTSAPIFDVAEGAAQRCRIVKTKGAIVDTLTGTGFRSLNTTRVEIYGDDDNWYGYYSFTDTPVFDMLNGGINPYGIFFPGRGRQLQFFENEQEARQLLDLVLSNCN